MSKTGRYFIVKDGRKFLVEPIDNTFGLGRKKWGDIDPATKTVQGDYGNKEIGAIHENDSIITKENGFKNITTLGVGVSPDSYINTII